MKPAQIGVRDHRSFRHWRSDKAPDFFRRFDKARIIKMGVACPVVRCRRCPRSLPTKGRFSPAMTAWLAAVWRRSCRRGLPSPASPHTVRQHVVRLWVPRPSAWRGNRNASGSRGSGSALMSVRAASPSGTARGPVFESRSRIAFSPMSRQRGSSTSPRRQSHIAGLERRQPQGRRSGAQRHLADVPTAWRLLPPDKPPQTRRGGAQLRARLPGRHRLPAARPADRAHPRLPRQGARSPCSTALTCRPITISVNSHRSKARSDRPRNPGPSRSDATGPATAHLKICRR